MTCKVSIPDDDNNDHHHRLSDNARRATPSCAHLRDEEGRVQAPKSSGAARGVRRALGSPALQLPVGLCRLAFACHGQCVVMIDPVGAVFSAELQRNCFVGVCRRVTTSAGWQLLWALQSPGP